MATDQELREFIGQNMANIHQTEKHGGFKRISGPEGKSERCRDKEHNPPGHICLKPGTYEYTCPSCGAIQVVNIPEITL